MQKTVLTPLFETSEKSIVRFAKQATPVLYNLFHRNMDIALQKLSANAFTRTVRKLIENDKVFLGYSASAVTSDVSLVHSIYVGDHMLLAGIIPDIIRCSPDTASDIVDTIKKIENNAKEIHNLQKRLDDASIDKVVKLKAENEKLQELLAAMIDYPRIAEAIYFSFVRYMIVELDKGTSIKLFDACTDLFKRIIEISIGNLMSIEDRRIYDASMDYIFTVSFTNLKPREVLHNITKRYGRGIADVLMKNGITGITSLENLATLLRLIKVLNITPIALNNAISKRFGTSTLSMFYGTYDYFVAWATVTAHHSILFNMGAVDKNIQLEIEKIVLNYKSKIRM